MTIINRKKHAFLLMLAKLIARPRVQRLC